MDEAGDPEVDELPVDLPLPKVGNVIAGYRLDKELGRGGTAIVFRATRLRDQHTCAFKMLQTRFWASGRLHRRLLREARILGELAHPNVVRILDSGGPPAAPPFMVTELVAGPSLFQVIKQQAPLPAQRCAEILLGVARGLAAIHGLSVVHRDLKPANIILTHSGAREVPKIFDFGLATAAEEEVHGTRFTQANDFLGTPAYMSPEQIRDPSQVGPATDLYALGMIAHELYLGHRPLTRPKKITQLIDADLTVPPLPVSGPLPALIESLLAVDPQARPANAAVVADALERLVPALPVETEPELEPSVVSRVIQKLELPEPLWTRISYLLIRREGPAPLSRIFVAFGLLGAIFALGLALYLRTTRAPQPIAVSNEAAVVTSPPPVAVTPRAAARPPAEEEATPTPPEGAPPTARSLPRPPPTKELNSARTPKIDPVPAVLAARGLEKADLPALGIGSPLLERYEAGDGAPELAQAIQAATIGPEVVRLHLQRTLGRLERLAGSPDFDALEARYFELRASLTADADETRCRQILSRIDGLDRELRARATK